MSEQYILTCSCHNMDKKALQAFDALFPNNTHPPIVRGKDRIYKLSKRLNNQHIEAISKLSGKFAYYVRVEDSVIAEEYDLVRGNRIA